VTIAASTHERLRTPSNSATDRAGMTIYELSMTLEDEADVAVENEATVVWF
jgi:hypothetical protein